MRKCRRSLTCWWSGDARRMPARWPSGIGNAGIWGQPAWKNSSGLLRLRLRRSRQTKHTLSEVQPVSPCALPGAKLCLVPIGLLRWKFPYADVKLGWKVQFGFVRRTHACSSESVKEEALKHALREM